MKTSPHKRAAVHFRFFAGHDGTGGEISECFHLYMDSVMQTILINVVIYYYYYEVLLPHQLTIEAIAVFSSHYIQTRIFRNLLLWNRVQAGMLKFSYFPWM